MILRALDRPARVRPALLVSGAAAVAFVLLTLAVLRDAGPLVRVDADVSAAAYRAAVQHPFWRSAMAVVTLTGSTAAITPVAAVGCLALVWRGAWRRACIVAVALAVTVLIRLAIVNVVARPRPLRPLAPAAGRAFPSGHATTAAAAVLITVLVCGPMLRARRSRLILAAVGAVWAAAVGVSRVALAVHWPSDVLGSWLLVLAVVPAVVVLCGAVLRRFSGPP